MTTARKDAAPLPVRAEGRENVWLIEPADLIVWLEQYPEAEIHNFMPMSGLGVVGADWERDQVIALVRVATRCAVLIGEARRHNFDHALAVIAPWHGMAGNAEELHMFDVGEITEADLSPVVSPEHHQ